MKYDFKTPVDRKGTGASKVNPERVRTVLGQNYYEDTISMWIADMDLACSPHIVERLKQRADRLIFGYTAPTDEYFLSITGWYARRQKVNLDPTKITYCNGALNGVKNLINAFSEVGDGVILQGPVYFPFYAKIKETKRTLLDNRLLKDENGVYSIDFADFEAKCKEAKLFILCNPHNPVGAIWKSEDVKKLLDIANANNVTVIADEVHSDLIRHSATFTSVLTLENNQNTVVVTGINKTFNLPGLQGSNLMFPTKEMQDQYLEKTGTMGINPFTLEATIAAYNQSEEWLDELRTVLDENMKIIEEYFQKEIPKIRFQVPEGTYLAWLDFTAFGLSEEELIKIIADDAHIALEGGKMFGEEGYIRMNIACPTFVLAGALDRLQRVFANR
ncbi:MAG: PatB family C-S lyase [Eubacteriales bacterium]